MTSTMGTVMMERKSKMESVKIKVKYLRDITKLNKIEIGDWIDLRAAEEMHFDFGERKLIPLGVAMELPEGYEAIMAPRSSLAKNFGLMCVNSIGVIDNSYCGDNDEWLFNAFALRETTIKVNDRICQFRIQKKQPDIEFEEVETLGNKDRGGIGSTGIK